MSDNEKKRIDQERAEKAKETLLKREDFNFETKTDDTTEYDSDIEDVDDSSVPNLRKFENKKSRYPKKLQSERFQEPRMFTMEQIRNITFACLNQSTMNDRVQLSEKKLVKMNFTCIRLDEMDRQIKFQAEEMNKNMQERVTKWKEE